MIEYRSLQIVGVVEEEEIDDVYMIFHIVLQQHKKNLFIQNNTSPLAKRRR